MKKTIILTVLIFFALFASLFFKGEIEAPTEIPEDGVVEENEENNDPTEASDVVVVAKDLEIPWDIAFLPDGDLVVTERPGRLVRIAPDGSRSTIPVPDVYARGEGGLLGLVLHPEFESNQYVYLYISSGGLGETMNKVVRYRLSDKVLLDGVTIIDGIPGARYHDGGRMEFGDDGLLYITTGDATRENIAQATDSLGGKILRVTDDGGVPQDNPLFRGDHTLNGNEAYVYSYGHRNPQGLAWDSSGRLWSTEHGRSGLLSGLDEINVITPGANYGWPVIEGDETSAGMRSPIAHSGASTTWAPAGLLYYKGSLFFGGLRGEALYEAVLDGENVREIREHGKGEYGRIRTVRVGPDGFFYILTSNRDGRGTVRGGDDKIIRLNPDAL